MLLLDPLIWCWNGMCCFHLIHFENICLLTVEYFSIKNKTKQIPWRKKVIYIISLFLVVSPKSLIFLFNLTKSKVNIITFLLKSIHVTITCSCYAIALFQFYFVVLKNLKDYTLIIWLLYGWFLFTFTSCLSFCRLTISCCILAFPSAIIIFFLLVFLLCFCCQ